MKDILFTVGIIKKLSDLLFENLGIMIPEEKELKTLKLYMPLTINTYDREKSTWIS